MKKTLEVVPFVLFAACGGVAEIPSGSSPGQDAGSDQSAGGSAGASAKDAQLEQNTGGAPDAYSDQGAECGPWGMSGADPSPAPVNCNDWTSGQTWQTSAKFNGTLLELRLQYYGGLGGWTDLSAVVAPELGTLVSIVDDGGPGDVFPAVSIKIALAAGSTGGSVAVKGILHGQDQCHVSVACPAQRTLKVELVDGGEPKVSLQVPRRVKSGRVALRLEGIQGLEACVVAEGITADTQATFSTTEGEVRVEGDRARWSLPARQGVYQVEVVTNDQGRIATDALVLEVREADARVGSPRGSGRC